MTPEPRPGGPLIEELLLEICARAPDTIVHAPRFQYICGVMYHCSFQGEREPGSVFHCLNNAYRIGGIRFVVENKVIFEGSALITHASNEEGVQYRRALDGCADENGRMNAAGAVLIQIEIIDHGERLNRECAISILQAQRWMGRDFNASGYAIRHDETLMVSPDPIRLAGRKSETDPLFEAAYEQINIRIRRGVERCHTGGIVDLEFRALQTLRIRLAPNPQVNVLRTGGQIKHLTYRMITIGVETDGAPSKSASRGTRENGSQGDANNQPGDRFHLKHDLPPLLDFG